ncbi:phage tail tube protein [Chenggangzhangella methanolivorans]|uniref:Phage tail protein n=1 Tax=Chenggangzhangella methanolivorans TaxID=1437009 RepID=A0A9E6R822_9HYPH|nr:phage tail tube protein [Chenggangzhangella methanolivorans]QZN99544.1 phage tail protein [Chenggangzhangella methanolivorans]
MADHSSTRTAYIKEVTPGVTPATPVFKILRATRAGGLRTNKETAESEEIREDGNLAALIQTGQAVSGPYPFELSYGLLDDWLESVMCGTWSTNQLRNGRVVNSYTVEETRRIGTNSFSRFTNVMASQLDLEVTAKQKITGTLQLMGVRETLAAAIVTGATYGSASTEPIMSAGASVGAITFPGLPAGGKIRSFKLSIANGLRDQPYIGSLYSDGFGLGQVKVTGEAEVYFSDQAIYNASLQHTAGLVSLILGSAANKKYKFDVGQAQIGDGEIVAGGNTDDIMARMPFTGVFDSSTSATLSVARAVT